MRTRRCPEALSAYARRLVANGATVPVVEHDPDAIRHADRLIDMGPGGGDESGRIVFTGAPWRDSPPPGIQGRKAPAKPFRVFFCDENDGNRFFS